MAQVKEHLPSTLKDLTPNVTTAKKKGKASRKVKTKKQHCENDSVCVVSLKVEKSSHKP
jgi:hypothetical protein